MRRRCTKHDGEPIIFDENHDAANGEHQANERNYHHRWIWARTKKSETKLFSTLIGHKSLHLKLMKFQSNLLLFEIYWDGYIFFQWLSKWWNRCWSMMHSNAPSWFIRKDATVSCTVHPLSPFRHLHDKTSIGFSIQSSVSFQCKDMYLPLFRSLHWPCLFTNIPILVGVSRRLLELYWILYRDSVIFNEWWAMTKIDWFVNYYTRHDGWH